METQEFIENYQEPANYTKIKEKIDNGICPDCGAKIAHAEGCVTCYFCGFSMCG